MRDETRMAAIGVDLGGTKIEVQLFDYQWQVAARNRVATPTTYPELIDTLSRQVRWAEEKAGCRLPVGVGAAGVVNPHTGLALAANTCSTGKPVAEDIACAITYPVTYLSDSRALALSEATFGAGQGSRVALSLVLGTGVGGGVTIDGQLSKGLTTIGGEIGHIGASANLLAEHKLPLHKCGCGGTGCIETLVSGPGLSRIAESVTGRSLSPVLIAQQRHTHKDSKAIWFIWCQLVADLLRTVTLTIDPDIIILAGGLSKIVGITEDISAAANRAQIGDFKIAPIVLAQGGDSSGARGAAYAAHLEAGS